MDKRVRRREQKRVKDWRRSPRPRIKANHIKPPLEKEVR